MGQGQRLWLQMQSQRTLPDPEDTAPSQSRCRCSWQASDRIKENVGARTSKLWIQLNSQGRVALLRASACGCRGIHRARSARDG